MCASAVRYFIRLLSAALLAGSMATGAVAQNVTLPVPTATIYPGDVISAGDLGERTFREEQVRYGIADSRSMLIGKVARRTLLPDHPVAINAVDEVAIVTRGTPVQVVFRQQGLVITAYASPLQDGSEGDIIRVRNADSGAIIMGVVQADGTVRVGLR